MLKQFVSSVLAHFVKIEPMNAYIQSIPKGVKYPCYLINKCDVKTNLLNSHYFMNTITLYIRIFGTNELELKQKAYKVTQAIVAERGKIPILNSDGSVSSRYIRVEDIESIEIPVDENEIYCIELNFSFDTTHKVNYEEFEILAKFYSNNRTQ